MSRICFDIESDGLLIEATKIHCICTKDLDTGDTRSWGPADIEQGLKYLSQADVLIGHNICGYDFKVMERLYQWKPEPNQTFVDTFILSCLMFPEGQHSLAYWAKRLHLKQQKVEHEDWSTFSTDMLWRCESDVIINCKIAEYLMNRVASCGNDFDNAEELEQEVAFVHSQQVINGVKLDIPKAITLYKELKNRLSSLEKKILQDVDKSIRIVGVAKGKQESARDEGMKGQNSHTKAGTYTAVNKNYFSTDELKEAEDLYENIKEDTTKDYRLLSKAGLALRELRKKILAQGPFTKIEVETLNLNSPTQVSKLLLDLGWKPTEYNVVKDPDGTWRQTGPKLTEDSYASLPPGLGQDIAQYNILKHRKSILLTQRKKDGKMTGLLALAQGREDGRVSADGFTCGTNTGRYRHFGVVNIPRPSTPYGKELRELFSVPYGSHLIGVDLSGIEAVVLAHYCLPYKDGQALVDEILKGDFHQANADLWGVDRDTAKSILYALMYGAGAKKLGSIANNGRDGARLKRDFFRKYPAIKLLITSLEKSYERHSKYIKTLDGRRVYIRSKHKLLNTLIQSAAAIIFKQWMVSVYETMPDEAMQVIAMHDELQIEYKGSLGDAEEYGQVLCRMAEKVGKELKIRVPVTAEAKVGRNWKECH